MNQTHKRFSLSQRFRNRQQSDLVSRNSADRPASRRQSVRGTRRSSILTPIAVLPRGSFTNQSGPFSAPTSASLNSVNRTEFTALLPKFLLAIVSEEKAETSTLSTNSFYDETFQSGGLRRRGIDIVFQDLSLSVKVGDSSVNVIDEVTGRIRAKSMTALMGGSGSGETCFVWKLIAFDCTKHH